MPTHTEIANCIRALSMDAVQAANSGHPGMPMGMADIATVLWRNFLKHNPKNPHWINRDRFVLSNGHGSMLLYSLLHLTGYDVNLDDLRNFRQLNAKTPGHPEYAHTPGVETTTGPLGQGLANAVGMAIAEKLLAATFNEVDHNIVDHHTYVFVGDGCLMEGISHEVCSLAGTLKLGKLIAIYDDNGISIDGNVEGWFTDNTSQRFQAYDWQVIDNIDGHDPVAIDQAISQAKSNNNQPSLIICKTHIGYGSPTVQDSAKSHGAPLGEEEIKATKAALNWPYQSFEIPQTLYDEWNGLTKGESLEKSWLDAFEKYQLRYPEKSEQLLRRADGQLPDGFQDLCQQLHDEIYQQAKDMATRKASEQCLNFLAPHLPELIGGSADLTGSNNTRWSNANSIDTNSFQGNYIHYGVREFGMAAIMNGLALHGGFISFGGTFLVFSDYARNAIRLSAMMKQKVIYVLSHDSIGLGEDGPTHQPIEHISMLRSTPDIDVWRPADGVETSFAWQHALTKNGASCLLLSRQTLPHLERNKKQIENINKGGYILKDCSATPEVILIATGSEVSIAIEAQEALSHSGKQVRVVSMPCVEVFLTQDKTYQESVLPNKIKTRIAIEAGSPDGWYRFTGLSGIVIGLSEYGLSAPYKEIYQAMGLNKENVVKTANSLLADVCGE